MFLTKSLSKNPLKNPSSPQTSKNSNSLLIWINCLLKSPYKNSLSMPILFFWKNNLQNSLLKTSCRNSPLMSLLSVPLFLKNSPSKSLLSLLKTSHLMPLLSVLLFLKNSPSKSLLKSLLKNLLKSPHKDTLKVSFLLEKSPSKNLHPLIKMYLNQDSLGNF